MRVLIITNFILVLKAIMDIIKAWPDNGISKSTRLLMATISQNLLEIISSVMESVYFLFGFMLRNLEIQLSNIELDEQVIVRKVIKNQRLAIILISCYLTEVLLKLTSRIIAKNIKFSDDEETEKDIGNDIWKGFIIFSVVVVCPIKIILFSKMLAIARRYK